MLSALINGIAIGLLFGVPAGAVGAMTVQRTMARGYKAGLLTGLGSSVADCLYACIGAFGLTLISDWLLKFQTPINIVGGVFILVMGVRLLLRKTPSEASPTDSVNGGKLFISSFAVGITNPAAILTFLFAFSWFGISAEMRVGEGISLVLGVFVGTYIWWGLLTTVTSLIKKKAANASLDKMNKIFGCILIFFAAVIFIRLFL